MISTIKNKLQEIQIKNNIKILYAIESGSRGWGFPSKDSDYDVRFIYLNKTEHYLSIFEEKDYIELPIDEVLDINGWDLKKVLRLLYKPNPNIIEWLSSPIVYKQETVFIESLRNIADQYYSPKPILYHYVSLAKKKFEDIYEKKEINIKKLFYVIRPIMACKWVLEKDSIPPMNLHDIMKEIKIEDEILNEINRLIKFKHDCIESDTIIANDNLIKYLHNQIINIDTSINNINSNNNKNHKLLNDFFIDTLKKYEV